MRSVDSIPSPRKRRKLPMFITLLVFCLSIWWIIAFTSRNQDVVIDFDYLADLNAPAQAVPESEQAWPPLRQALLSLDLQGRASVMEFLGDFKPESADESVSEWFDRNHSGLARIREALSREGLGFIHVQGVPEDDDRLVLLSGFERDNAESLPAGVDSSFEAPGFTALDLTHRFTRIPRALSLILTHHAEKSAKEGASLVAAEDIVASLDLARLVHEDRLLISQLVGHSIVSLSLKSCLRMLTDPEAPLDVSALELLARTFDDPRYRPPPIDFHGEQAALRDIIQRYYTNDGSGDGLLDFNGFVAMSAATGAQLPVPLRVGLVRSILGPFLTSAASTRAEVEAVSRRCFQTADDLQAQEFWSLDWTEHDAAFAPLLTPTTGVLSSLNLFPLSLMIAHLDAAILQVYGIRFKFDVVRLVVALQLHRIDRGEWPDTLQNLVPDFISEIPRDPFDGAPVRYRLIDGEPRLWSVGPDGIGASGITLTRPQKLGLILQASESGGAGEDILRWPLAPEEPSSP